LEFVYHSGFPKASDPVKMIKTGLEKELEKLGFDNVEWVE